MISLCDGILFLEVTMFILYKVSVFSVVAKLQGFSGEIIASVHTQICFCWVNCSELYAVPAFWLSSVRCMQILLQVEVQKHVTKISGPNFVYNKGFLHYIVACICIYQLENAEKGVQGPFSGM